MTSLRLGPVGHVLIVGAGIGGLTTALQLHRAGIDCTIVESVREFRPVGVGINILPQAAQQLGALGLESALSSGSVLTRESVFYNRFGQTIFREPAGRYAGYPDPQYSIHRAHLHQVLLDAVSDRLGQETVLTGHRVVSIEQTGERGIAEIERADASTMSLEADLIIGADGIHSVVRKHLFPHEGPPRYTGVTMWRGTTVWPPFLTGASMVRAGWITCGQLVVYPILDNVDGHGNQLVNWVVELETSQRVERGWNQTGRLDDFISYFRDWQFEWLDVPSMLSQADMILEYPMVDQLPLPHWTDRRVTLLGDAAHPMIPRGSNGAAQTILDARALADCLLANRRDPIAALQAYEDQRRPATARVVLANQTHSPDSILREVFERTGDRPFVRVEDVIAADELGAISENYKRITAYTIEGDYLPSNKPAGARPR
jgi:2-polyprenyl-6-methoxyphenol hydroxylase-like FAD-dependent oxidoreductase